jgi:glycosyltransferase involved in cell wall biosynthesis
MNKTTEILIVIPFTSIYPPTSGGKQRCFHVLHQLSRYFSLTVISSLDKQQIEKAKSNYESLRSVNFIYIKENQKTPKLLRWLPNRIANALYYRIITRTIYRPTQSFIIKFYKPVLQLLSTSSFDFVIHEYIDSLELARVLKRKYPRLLQIYNAYNFDTELYKHQYESGLIDKRVYQNTKLSEENLHSIIDILWTCSYREAELFQFANCNKIKKIDVIPNGTELVNFDSTIIESHKNEFQIIFVGSLDYEPNVEGLLWFLKCVYPLITFNFTFQIIGSGKLNKELNNVIKSLGRVEFVGFVENLDSYYLSSDLVVIPLLSGSGTRLKALEAMNYQRAIISTAKGVEGIDIIDEVLIEDDAEVFASRIDFLLNNMQERLTLGHKSRSLIENKYDWKLIGEKLKLSLSETILINSK